MTAYEFTLEDQNLEKMVFFFLGESDEIFNLARSIFTFYVEMFSLWGKLMSSPVLIGRLKYVKSLPNNMKISTNKKSENASH